MAKHKHKHSSASSSSNVNWKKLGPVVGGVIAVLAVLGFIFMRSQPKAVTTTTTKASTQPTQQTTTTYQPSQEEIDYLKNKFDGLTATNNETVGYVYAPGTELDEPVVQTTDNATYLDKTFDGGYEPLMGTVFMDMDNHKNMQDRLTWLFGHARGSQVGDHRMFNDVNYYSDQNYFDQHKYVVVETPERKYYYEAAIMVIVPEENAFYRTDFVDDNDFKTQLQTMYDAASVKKKDLKINPADHYLVLSTCREEDPTIRANLYLRQIPDSEMTQFVKDHGSELQYTPTRG